MRISAILVLFAISIPLTTRADVDKGLCRIDYDHASDLTANPAALYARLLRENCVEEKLELRAFYTREITRIQFLRSKEWIGGVGSLDLLECTHSLLQGPSESPTDLGFRCTQTAN